MPKGHITEHFTWEEFACHDGTPVPEALQPNVIRLCGALEVIRARVGKPLRVLSGYRTPEYNSSRPGTAKNSQHCQGKAADLAATGIAPEVLKGVIANLIRDGLIPNGGLGLYEGFVHYDQRDGIARWDETKARA